MPLALAFTRGARNISNMTTMTVIDGDRGETRTMAVARRLRGQLAERDISGLELARRTGLSQSLISRRRTGETAYSIEELDLICNATGIDYNFVTTGVQTAKSPHPDGPDGGLTSRLRESNSRPFHYLSDGSAEIVSLFPAAPSYDELGIPA